jgi:hypothetical protein
LLSRTRHVVEDKSSFVGCVQRRLEHRQVLAPDDQRLVGQHIHARSMAAKIR